MRILNPINWDMLYYVMYLYYLAEFLDPLREPTLARGTSRKRLFPKKGRRRKGPPVVCGDSFEYHTQTFLIGKDRLDYDSPLYLQVRAWVFPLPYLGRSYIECLLLNRLSVHAAQDM